MDVKEIDVVCPKLPERRLEGEVHGLDVVPHVHDFLSNGFIFCLVVVSVLESGQRSSFDTRKSALW